QKGPGPETAQEGPDAAALPRRGRNHTPPALSRLSGGGGVGIYTSRGHCPLVNDRVQLKDISNVNYVSTENILQDFGGVAVANKLPTVNSVSSFQAGDVLLANIRPYLKKVWAANFSGGASNDVLVFRPRNSQGGQYVAHILKNNRFINYVMAGAKGVKMPRGDINSIKEYPVPIPPETTEQQKIAHCLSSLDEVIGLESHKLDALKNLKKGLMQQLFPQEVA
ncbi:restriction endonuclease subunit S, partial [Thiolapillus sp.]|uniref:restriction endonuclease subunit S n=1 Tax=Thiolapillus sp. TaxID=2017437 RepID=UPI003AF56222